MAANLRARLGRALVVALSPVLVIGAVSSFFGYREEVDDRRRLLEASALRGAAETRARFESGAVVLSLLAPELVGVDCAPRLRAVTRRLTGYENLARLDATGRVACAAQTLPSNPGRSQALWFQRLAQGEPFVVAQTPADFGVRGASLIAASRVDAPDGRFDGALVSVIAASSLRPALGSGAAPAGTEVAVLTRAGRLITGRDAQAFPQAVSRPTQEDRALVYRGRDRSGRLRDFAAARLIGDELLLVLSAPAGPNLFSWAQLNPLFSLGLPILAFALAFGAVWLAADRMMIRWLKYLQRIAAVYARGRFTVRPSVAADAPEEIQALARTLDEMAETITIRDQTLRENLAQKDALLREIHHRVKNNLQVITSLLNLQQRALADPAGRAVLADTRQRITALALIYRALYQSEDLRRVDVRSFLEELVAHLVNGDGRDQPIRAEVQADELMLDPDKLAPFALYAVEAVSNAQKHAFAEGGGTLQVRFRRVDGEGRLEIEDDGVGADGEGDPAQGGVGRTLMNAFARQLRGRSELEARPEGGMAARLIFPLPEPVPAES